MKFLKKILLYTLVIAHILFIVILASGFICAALNIDLFADFDPYNIIWNLPTVGLTMIIMAVGAFADKLWIVILGFGVPLASLIGCFRRNKSKWGYRILVYPILLLSLLVSLQSTMDTLTEVIAAAAYFATAVIVDVLPD